MRFVFVAAALLLAACDEPKEICAEYTTNIVLMPYYNGQTTMLMPQPISECVRYVPNPKYKPKQ